MFLVSERAGESRSLSVFGGPSGLTILLWGIDIDWWPEAPDVSYEIGSCAFIVTWCPFHSWSSSPHTGYSGLCGMVWTPGVTAWVVEGAAWKIPVVVGHGWDRPEQGPRLMWSKWWTGLPDLWWKGTSSSMQTMFWCISAAIRALKATRSLSFMSCTCGRKSNYCQRFLQELFLKYTYQ